jgi:hypothetical protein
VLPPSARSQFAGGDSSYFTVNECHLGQFQRSRRSAAHLAHRVGNRELGPARGTGYLPKELQQLGFNSRLTMRATEMNEA